MLKLLQAGCPTCCQRKEQHQSTGRDATNGSTSLMTSLIKRHVLRQCFEVEVTNFHKKKHYFKRQSIPHYSSQINNDLMPNSVGTCSKKLLES